MKAFNTTSERIGQAKSANATSRLYIKIYSRVTDAQGHIIYSALLSGQVRLTLSKQAVSVSSLIRTTTVGLAKVISCQRPLSVRFRTRMRMATAVLMAMVPTSSMARSRLSTPWRWIQCLSLSRKPPSMFRINTPFKYLVFHHLPPS